jgi:putative tryptophan/tyrosine transport system substrate-binding protein
MLLSRHTRRRDFITLLGGAAAAWPLAARAQQAAMHVIGWLYAGAPVAIAHLVPGFRQGLNDTGFIEGQNVTIEYRFAEGQYDRLPNLVADLIRRQVTVIVTPGSPVAALAAKDATMTIPIVFSMSEDPIRLGLVDSFARPGGNATGVNFFISELGAKGLGLLRELLPSAERFGALVNPNNPTSETWTRDVTAAASFVGVQVDVINARDGREIGRAFETLIQNRTDALLIAPDSVFFNRRIQLATLATRHAVPAIYPWREAVEIGGLMSYGTNLPDVYRQLGIYTGRILKGASPSDLPVVQPTKFELVISLITVKALGLDVPPTLLARADEVIE